MLGVVSKIVVTLVLLAIVWISFLFLWGTTHRVGSGASIPVLFGSLIVGISCLWGIRLIWRRRIAMVDQSRDPAEGSGFDENAFDLWLAHNSIQTAGMSERQLIQLRQRFLNERI